MFIKNLGELVSCLLQDLGCFHNSASAFGVFCCDIGVLQQCKPANGVFIGYWVLFVKQSNKKREGKQDEYVRGVGTEDFDCGIRGSVAN